MPAAVAGSDAGDRDKPLRPMPLHGGDQASRALRELGRGLAVMLCADRGQDRILTLQRLSERRLLEKVAFGNGDARRKAGFSCCLASTVTLCARASPFRTNSMIWQKGANTTSMKPPHKMFVISRGSFAMASPAARRIPRLMWLRSGSSKRSAEKSEGMKRRTPTAAAASACAILRMRRRKADV